MQKAQLNFPGVLDLSFAAKRIQFGTEVRRYISYSQGTATSAQQRGGEEIASGSGKDRKAL